MKKAINIRLEENILLTLETLSKEFHTTKTDIIEKAIQHFSKEKHQKQNDLLEFAGVLDSKEADSMIEKIENGKNTKNFSLDL